jgi:uncharacterized protein (DUF433 family)
MFERDRLECCSRSYSLCMFVRCGNIQRLWLRPQHSKRPRGRTGVATSISGEAAHVSERVILSSVDPKQIVHSDPEIVSGTPVFVGTRVPAQALLDYLEGGETIDEFLDDFPSVSRERAIAFLEDCTD